MMPPYLATLPVLLPAALRGRTAAQAPDALGPDALGRNYAREDRQQGRLQGYPPQRVLAPASYWRYVLDIRPHSLWRLLPRHADRHDNSTQSGELRPTRAVHG